MKTNHPCFILFYFMLGDSISLMNAHMLFIFPVFSFHIAYINFLLKLPLIFLMSVVLPRRVLLVATCRD